MNEKIIERYNSFQIADLDDDMVGMCKAMVDWIQEINNQIQGEVLPKEDPPFNFYKLDPHQPKMESRKNYRKFLSYAVRSQDESTDDITKLKNIYIAILAGLYMYHMPVDGIIEAGHLSDEFTRDMAKDLLLNDNMSPNWLKEPSGKDFSAIML